MNTTYELLKGLLETSIEEGKNLPAKDMADMYSDIMGTNGKLNDYCMPEHVEAVLEDMEVKDAEIAKISIMQARLEEEIRTLKEKMGE